MADGQWADWVGRTRTTDDTIDIKTARALAATLGSPSCPVAAPDDALPYPWIWTYFLEPVGKDDLGPDGHPKRGGFLPPIPNPRRMWAGSRCTFHGPIKAGRPASRTSTIESVTAKEGRVGPMVFVTVVHAVESDGDLAMREEQDLVYMDIPDRFRPPEAQTLPTCEHAEPVDIDPVFLFRFSALTFNGHRIHYDRPYSVDVEKYPGLVVQGPLQAILLYEFGRRLYPNHKPAAFRFRGVRPLFDFDEAHLNARETETGEVELFTSNGEGAVAMKATLTWSG